MKQQSRAMSVLTLGNQEDQYARMTKLAHAAFAREVLRKVTNVFLPLNDGGAGSAFYCVHSIMGMATDFRHMARMLGPAQRFYGIQAPTAKRNADFAKSIEAISQYYVDQLSQFQPEGGIILGGHSVGAVIALEMAQQLRARGRDVDLVVVFDGELFNTGTEISSRNPLYWLRLMVNLPLWIRDFLLVEFTFAAFCQTVFRKVVAASKKIRGRLTPGGLSTGHAVEGFVDIKNATPDHVAFMKTLYETQFQYMPKQYPGRVVVYVAKTQSLMYLRQVAAAWRKVAPEAEIVYCKGTHTSMLREPQGWPLAKHLAQRIAEIAADHEYVAGRSATAREMNITAP
jgi:thioesterase domain-containing protein